MNTLANDPELVQLLHAACSKNQRALIRQALNSGADIDAPFTNGHTPLFKAVLDANFELAEMLLELGADPSQGCGKISSTSLIKNHLAISLSDSTHYYKPLARLADLTRIFAERAALNAHIRHPSRPTTRVASL